MAALPKYAVLDGGMATELVRRGHQDIDDDPLWSSRLLQTQPDEVVKVHESFLEAGSDIIETNTYQASVAGFVKHLGVSQSEASDLIRKGVELACQARDAFWENHKDSDRQRPLVAGSVGPYGASLHDGSEYSGKYVDSMTLQDLEDWHRSNITLILEAGADLVAVDTIPAQKEAEAIVGVLAEFPSSRAWISFSCQNGERTNHGEKIIDAARSLLSCPNIVGVGVNCTSPDHIQSLLHHLQPLRDQTALIVYPNSGETWSKEHRWEGKDSCAPLHSYVPQWLDSGARWIGGCCRTTPDDIRNIRSTLKERIT